MSGLRIPVDGPDGAGTASVVGLRAPNASPLTLDGTNTWIIGQGETVLVVDPGPDDRVHLQRIVDHLGDRRVSAVLLTHGHRDHSGGAATFAAMVRAPVRALDPRHRLGEEGLVDGQVVSVDGAEVRVVGTPGHSFDSLCFWLPDDQAMLTGDTIIGRGTSVIAPDGDLGDYLRSLDRLRGGVEILQARVLLPGHGPVLSDPVGVLDRYLARRRRRLNQVREAVRSGARDVQQIVAIIYGDVNQSLRPAAEASVRAHLAYLSGSGDTGVPDP